MLLRFSLVSFPLVCILLFLGRGVVCLLVRFCNRIQTPKIRVHEEISTEILGISRKLKKITVVGAAMLEALT
jgi:hypothetical protein